MPQCRALWEVGLDWAWGLTKPNLIASVYIKVRTPPACPCGTGRVESLLERGMLLSPPVAWEWALAQAPCSVTSMLEKAESEKPV